MINALRIAWTHEGGRWRRYYFLHPWRLYYVIRDQRPDKAKWVRVEMDDAEVWAENTLRTTLE
jgi:hypothetical protein